MRPLPSLLAIACLAAASGLTAQTAPFESELRPSILQTGRHRNLTDQEKVVFETIVRAKGAAWVRLAVDEAWLPGGSYIEITAVKDGHRQRLNADELRLWSRRSAYFNGELLFVRLVAAPRTTGVFFETSHIVAGIWRGHVGPASQCGPVDNRVPSTDKRTGRLMPIGCTAWLISNTNCFVTAGHCATSSAQVVQFNVPPSSSSGSPVNPGPQDQYPVIASTIQRTSGGIGNDWGVFQTAKNSVTGKHAGAAQGAFFTLAYAKPAVNSTIRITGYGVDRDQRTRSQTNQTHTGPLATNSGTQLCYVTDTEGGNSGSPVIDDRTGNAVGVHTHGGCTTSGTGCNSGTSTTLPTFRAAIAALRCDPPLCNNDATYAVYGKGCLGTGRTPCASLNGQGGTLNTRTLANEYCYAVKATAAITVVGFRLFTRSTTGGNATTTTALYLASGSLPSTTAARTGTLTAGTTTGFYTTTLSSPVTIAAGQTFWISQYDSSNVLPASLASGNAPPAPTYWRRPPGSGSWTQTTIIRFPSYQLICSGSGNAVPQLTASGLPGLGTSYRVDLSGAKASTPALFLLGFSKRIWGAVPLPLDLTPFGAPGRSVLAAGDIILNTTTDKAGLASVPFTTPRDRNLCGLHLYHQYVVFDPTANSLGFAVSNGGDAHYGN